MNLERTLRRKHAEITKATRSPSFATPGSPGDKAELELVTQCTTTSVPEQLKGGWLALLRAECALLAPLQVAGPRLLLGRAFRALQRC